MPAKKLTRDELIAKARAHIATHKRDGRSDAEVAEMAVAALYADNFKLRSRLRDSEARGSHDADSAKTIARLEREIEEHEREIERLEGLIPGDGAAVLSKADADELKTLRTVLAEHKLEAGKLADRLKAAVDDATFRAEQQERTRYADAAKAFGYDDEVLADIVKTRGLHLEMKDVRRKKRDANGRELDETETVAIPHVRSAANASEALVPLDEYATQHLAKYLPSLTAAQDDSTGGSHGGRTSSSSTTTGGVRMPAQPGTGGKPAAPMSRVATSYVDRTYVTPSQRNAKSAE